MVKRKIKAGASFWMRWKSSYRGKITISVTLLVMLFLFVGFAEMYGYTRQILLNRAYDNMRREASACSAGIESGVANTEDLTLSILGNTGILDDLGRIVSGGLSGQEEYQLGENIRHSLGDYALWRKEIASIDIATLDGTTYSYSKIRLPAYDQITGMSGGIYAREGRVLWFASDRNCTAMSCARALNDLSTYRPLGLVSVNISESYFRSLYGEWAILSGGDAFIIDEENRIISSCDGERLGEVIEGDFVELLSSSGEFYSVQENGDGVYISERMRNNWRLALTVPASFYLRGLSGIAAIFLTSALLMTALASLVVRQITLRLTRPVYELAAVMQDFGTGDLEARSPVEAQDEIGMLSATFNKMAEDMNDLYARAYEQQILRQDAELRALQMQINPHFLYNALDTINWKARFSGADDVGEMACCLGYLLRYSLEPGDFSTLSREISGLEYYLKIQNYRYSDRLTTVLDIDPAFYEIEIPKLLIQPIVENAIVHGIEAKVDSGAIRIWAERAGEDDFLIHVDDDGVGMTEEACAAILSEKEGRDRAHIGVYNVHRRLQMHYGEGYGLTIHSAPGVGTRVTLRLKAR